jgi:hypothetical protein
MNLLENIAYKTAIVVGAVSLISGYNIDTVSSIMGRDISNDRMIESGYACLIIGAAAHIVDKYSSRRRQKE